MASESLKYDHQQNAVLGKTGNHSFVCQTAGGIGSRGFWFHENPLHFSAPLLLLQLFVSTITTMFFDSILLPLGQSTIVSQLLGGLLFGPSILGLYDVLGRRLFPPRGSIMFETLSLFGLMFFIFVVGLKSDASMMLRPGRMAMLIGISVMLMSFGLTFPFAFLIKKYIPMEPSLSNSIHLIAASQCVTAFPNIACLLTELKILNTDLGGLAVSSSMYCDMLGMLLATVTFAIMFSTSAFDAVLAVIALFVLLSIIFFIFRPVVLGHILKRAQEGKLGETHYITVFVFVMIVGLASEVIGQHFVFGPLVLGLALPEGPPLASALVDKLHYPIAKILYPTYLTASGLKTNIFTIHLQSLWIVGLIFLFSSLVKIGTVMLLAFFMGMPVLDGVVVGLMLNARGTCELILYNLWMDNQVLAQQEFASTVIMVILVTAIITPLIKYLHNPSRKLLPLKKWTIQHAKRDEELRILLCIHNQDNVPSILNLLEASHATEESPITAIALILVELIGRTTPMLIAHQANQTLEPTKSRSGHIVNALRAYESHNKGRVAVQPYTSISHFETMPDDICRVVLDQCANIVIIPFHKTWAIDGKFGQANRAIKEFNLKVMEKVPCTAGILIDRGTITSGSLKILNAQSIYNVAVIYIGGLDDVESLCYGARMATHEKVILKVIRFLLFGTDNARERKFDNNLIDEVRNSQVRNERFMYQEEVVRDGVGLASAIRKFEHGFDLMIVGKNHQDSPLMAGLDAWSECPELGVIGDLLASPDIATSTSVLVVQQQRAVGGKLTNRSSKPVVVDTHYGVSRVVRTTSPSSNNDNNNININNNNSWAISMNRD